MQDWGKAYERAECTFCPRMHNRVWFPSLCGFSWSYLIFVIFSPQTQTQVRKVRMHKCVWFPSLCWFSFGGDDDMSMIKTFYQRMHKCMVSSPLLFLVCGGDEDKGMMRPFVQECTNVCGFHPFVGSHVWEQLSINSVLFLCHMYVW